MKKCISIVFCIAIWLHFNESIWATSWGNPFMPYANNKGADQPAHPRSLISAFVVRCPDNIIPLVSISEISSIHQASVAAQASLCLTWLQTLTTGFLVARLILCKKATATGWKFKACNHGNQTFIILFFSSKYFEEKSLVSWENADPRQKSGTYCQSLMYNPKQMEPYEKHETSRCWQPYNEHTIPSIQQGPLQKYHKWQIMVRIPSM